MRKLPRFVQVLIALMAVCGLHLAGDCARAEAQEIVIKLGTMAPAGSPWHNLLKEMGQRWKEVSGGRVVLRIYPGGVLGNEGDLIRKMRIGQLQGAALTSISLHDITPEPSAINAPFVVTSYPELDYVMSKITPKLDDIIAQRGYIVIEWGAIGFVRFFSTKPLRSPADAKDHKVFVWEGDPNSVSAWRTTGFQPVVLSSTDVVPALQTGMIDTVAAAPMYAFTARIFQKANKMMDLNWAALVGATLIRKEAWEQIPADLRPQLLDIAHQFGRRIQAEVQRMNDDALAQMKKQGLEVIAPVDIPGWRHLGDLANKVVRGSIVPAPIFDEVLRLAAEYRAGKR